jgi:hypothetical protein
MLAAAQMQATLFQAGLLRRLCAGRRFFKAQHIQRTGLTAVYAIGHAVGDQA